MRIILYLSIFLFTLNTQQAAGLEKSTADSKDFSVDDGLLDFDQYEKLSLFEKGLAFSFGRAIPWQKLSFSYYKKMSETGNRFLTISVGGGNFDMEGDYEYLDYEINTDSYSIYSSYRYYFTDFANFYVEPQLGAAYWSGTTGAGGVDADKVEAQEMYENTFKTAGLVVAGNLGILWQFDGGFFIDYSILRMSYSVPIYADYENDNTGEDVTRSQIIGPHLWGSINLTLGYMF